MKKGTPICQSEDLSRIYEIYSGKEIKPKTRRKGEAAPDTGKRDILKRFLEQF